jgi:hypothetical protein
MLSCANLSEGGIVAKRGVSFYSIIGDVIG